MFTKSTRKQQLLRILSLYLAFSLLFDYIAPVAAFALTSGPGQPEFSSFEPVGTSDMVDLYSGDFTYNIPLLSVPGPNGGYPINLAYHSGPGVDEEASWTGLGWTVNVGAVNRQLRGLPDDFKGDNVVQKYRLKTNRTTTLNLYGQKSELFGYPQSVSSSALTSISPQIYYNSYKGLGYRVTLGINASKTYINYGLQMSYDSQNGVGVEPDFSVAGTIKGVEIKANGGVGYSSREGIRGSFAVTPSPVIVLSQSQLSFSSQFNVPSVSVPMRTDIFPFSAHINLTNGTSAFPGAFSAAWPKSWSGSVIESKVDNGGYVSSDGYGYLYNSHSSNTADLKDFQRGYIPYSKKVPNLPPSHLTYDMFMQTAQGTGSSFRSYSNYVGVTGDPLRQSNDYSTQLNLEVGTMSVPSTPPALHFGIGYTSETGANKSGPWIDVGSTSDVVFGSILDYKRINEIKRSEPDFEDSPFKVYGEKTGTLLSEDLLSLWGGDEAVRVDLDMSNDQSWLDRQFIAKNQFIRHAGDPSPITAGASHNLKTPQRQRRSTNIEQLTGPEAQKYGVTRNVSYTVNPSGGYDFLTPVAKTFNTTGDKSNHISEMSVVQADGMRYIYGLPAYNNKQVDISFAANVSGSPNFNTKYANMDPLDGSHPWDVSTAGTTDDYVSQTELPPFVHSWLLTAVVSDDYVDLTDNGPTEDDYGYWVNFSYKKESTDYAWHIPYKDANYVEGNKGDPTDDRATASYGNREQYYLEYVETKTHIAVFYTSVREDGL